MKKNIQHYAIIGLVIILVAGFTPSSSANDIAITQNEFELLMDSLSVKNLLPIETTLSPLTDISDTSFFTDSKLAEREINADIHNTIMEFDLNSGAQKIVSKENLESIDIDPNIFQPQEDKSRDYQMINQV